jgi:plastocyanin
VKRFTGGIIRSVLAVLMDPWFTPLEARQAMRGNFLVAGGVLFLAACGGEKKAEAPAAAAPEAAAPAPATEAPAMAAAPAPTGATIDVNMELVGSTYKYDPSTISAKAGDVIKFHNKSGGPHNVAFDAAGIPSGSAAAIDAALGATKMGPLMGALVLEPDAVITISTAGFPAGTYNFHCTPHQALGMKGALTVN